MELSLCKQNTTSQSRNYGCRNTSSCLAKYCLMITVYQQICLVFFFSKGDQCGEVLFHEDFIKISKVVKRCKVVKFFERVLNDQKVLVTNWYKLAQITRLAVYLAIIWKLCTVFSFWCNSAFARKIMHLLWESSKINRLQNNGGEAVCQIQDPRA